ncbi:DUF6448 family protein [Fodinibius sp. SL11]|uniref:DUF6448 family protein n=1 Tax=Fodinibius sp. SL11 TaxID=3425690 RepID=UPI003F8831E2
MMLQLKTVKLSALIAFFFLAGLTFPQQAEAHCDRINGPVAVDARKALETGDVGHALIWVTEKQSDELKSVFEQARKVYVKGDESKELAERYFMETTVRLHREAEGMPFTGLKPAQPNPKDIAVAEEALQSGDVEPVATMLASEIKEKVTELHQQAIETQGKKSESVASGREAVDAYVRYIVYVHSLYKTIQSGPAHGIGN